MGPRRSRFDQAAEALQRAIQATSFGEQERLLEEALRLNRLAPAEERAKRTANKFSLPKDAVP
jgi:hypothetical protein